MIPWLRGDAPFPPLAKALKSPKLEGDRLTFDVDVLEGDLTGGDGAVSVFTDVINLPAPLLATQSGSSDPLQQLVAAVGGAFGVHGSQGAAP